ncbi:hypothetical protein TUMEXPCC7403_11495 [Tumidithrix helvetica PCC 7403]|uniref:hypothetical protein n=1 Tax=Tumidithrix helvetica TaxID=3457545 RepID=UPI003CA30194
MISTWSNSIDKTSSLICKLPNSFQGRLGVVYQQHYEELYESEAGGTTSLQDALNDILSLFHIQSSSPTLSHLRYVWMALILASVVEPTVKYYQPDNSIPEKTMNRLSLWLIETLTEMLSDKNRFSREAKKEEENNILDSSQFFSENNKISSFQVLYEALDVYKNAIEVLDPKQALEALRDILDDCLEGYAIFPGSYGRRELFDWWLLDVVPASWCLVAPNSIYSTNEKHIASDRIDKLQEISFAMESVIRSASEDRMRESLPVSSNSFVFRSNKIETNKFNVTDIYSKSNPMSNLLFRKQLNDYEHISIF